MTVLIVLEGIDGAGTTTQTERLAAALRADGRDVHATREPSDGPVGKLLRRMLAGEHAPVDAATMALLFAADRADHLQREIEPALARGAVVISDRYYHSSLAYQGSDEDRAWIAELNARARRPALTVFLRVAPDVAAQRLHGRGGDQELYEALDTQRRVAASYERIVQELRANERIEILDGERDADAVAAEVAALVRSCDPR